VIKKIRYRRVHQSANWLTASWLVGELSSKQFADLVNSLKWLLKYDEKFGLDNL